MSVHRMHRRSITVPVLLLTAVIALTGCSGAALAGSLSREAAEITAAPATGPTVSRYGYSFAAPAGWSVPSDVSMPGLDVIVGNLADTDGFVDNLNVVLAGGIIKPALFETQGVRELEKVGATDVITRGRVKIAGSESAHLSANMAFDGVETRAEQFYVSSEKETYIITFTFSLTVPKSEREALAHSVLASWAWV